MTNFIVAIADTLKKWSFKYNCYETVHPFTPYCSHSAIEISGIVFGEAIKLYTPLYLFSQFALQQKYDAQSFRQTAKSILRSTSFISANAFFALIFFCSSQTLTGKFYYHLSAYTPAFVASSMAVMIEKPSRRSSLAFYVSNVASEALYRIYVDRGYIKPIPHGQVYLFTISIATLMYLANLNGFESDPLSSAIRAVIGDEEARKYRRKQTQVYTSPSSSCQSNDSDKTTQPETARNKHDTNADDDDDDKQFTSILTHQHAVDAKKKTKNLRNAPISEMKTKQIEHEQEAQCDIIDTIELIKENDTVVVSNATNSEQSVSQTNSNYDSNNGSNTTRKLLRNLQLVFKVRHELCPHKSTSCMHYASRAALRALLCGYLGQLSLRLAARLPSIVAQRNQVNVMNEFVKLVSDRSALRFGVFLSLFSAIFKSSSCCLRWKTNKSSAGNNFIAGLLAGPTFFLHPSPTLALYVVWKCVENLFHEGTRRNEFLATYSDAIVVILYGLSTSQLFYAAILDPSHLKRSYMAFLNRMSRNRLQWVNRSLLDVFGTQASLGYEDFFPDLHPKYLSRQFMGSIWVWLIEQRFVADKFT